MKILFVHGIGHTDLDQNYYQPWVTDVTNQLKSSGLPTDPRYQRLTGDPLFQQYEHDPANQYRGTSGISGLGGSLVPNSSQIKPPNASRFYLA